MTESDRRGEIGVHLRPIHNTDQPIFRLPPEILCQILEFCLTPGSYKMIPELQAVCKTFYDSVKSSPRMMCTVTTEMPMDVLEEAMRRFPNHLLFVSSHKDLGDSPTPKSQRRPLRLDIISRVVSKSAQWGTLTWAVPHFTPWLIGGISEASHLSSLTLVNDSMWTKEKRLRLPPGAPLTELRLTGFDLDWSTVTLSDLTLFAILKTTTPPPLQTVVSIVSSSPCLKSLCITLDKWPSTAVELAPLQEASPELPIRLQHLKTLVLSNLPEKTTSALMSVLEAPSCTQICVDILPSASPEFPLYHLIRWPLEQSLGTVSLHWTEGFDAVQILYQNPTQEIDQVLLRQGLRDGILPSFNKEMVFLGISVKNRFHLRNLIRFIQSFPNLRLLPKISPRYTSFQPLVTKLSLDSILEDIGPVESLYITGSYSLSERIIRKLLEVTPLEDGSFVGLCPLLKSLRFGPTAFVDAKYQLFADLLVRLMRSRKGFTEIVVPSETVKPVLCDYREQLRDLEIHVGISK